MRRIAIGVIAAAMVLAACGGSSKKSVASGGSTSTTGSGGGSGNTSGGSGGNSDLSALAAQYAKAKIKITYTSTGESNGFTLAQNGSGKSAFTSGNSTLYTDGKSTISCDGTGATAKCVDMGSLGGVTGGLGSTFTATFSALASLLSSVGGGHSSSETIAGRDASCVTFKASDVIGRLKGLPLFKNSTDKASDYDPNDTATICVDKQTGFVVKLAGTKKGQPQSDLTATAISEPSDSDFTPPVTPQTIPPVSLPSGITIPSGISVPSG